METMSRKGTLAWPILEATQAPAFTRMANGGLVAGSPTWGELHELIAQRAYAKAQQRGFAPGHESDDWFAAEHELRNFP
jgi:Protein of unknown function (DUF2934)